MSQRWNPFPYDNDKYDYPGASLEDNWERLHRGDREPFPAGATLTDSGGLAKDQDAAQAATELQDAWRAYHRGDFQAAFEAGMALGPVGYYVANKAAGIHAVYLEEDEATSLETFREIAERCEQTRELMPDHANSHYFHAFALGRYSQGISVAKALAQGLGGKIKQSLDRTLALEPEHADAHTALGLYHAEVLDKVGKMVGKLTYGASRDAALDHFRTAGELFPESAITRIERANGLLLLDGDKAYDAASDLYVAAAEAEPADAMERLDVELASSELE